MQIGYTVKIKNTNSVFDGKTGLVEDIDEEEGYCTVFVDFIPEEGKKVRQDFKLDTVEPSATTTNESLTEDDDDNIDYLNDESHYEDLVRQDLAKKQEQQQILEKNILQMLHYILVCNLKHFILCKVILNN